MAEVISKSTQVKLLPKDIVIISMIVGGFFTMYFTMKSDINEAKELPKPPVTQEQVRYENEIVKTTIMSTQKDVERVKQDVSEIKETLRMMEQRQYENKLLTWPRQQK